MLGMVDGEIRVPPIYTFKKFGLNVLPPGEDEEGL
jgi:hypothetical protein